MAELCAIAPSVPIREVVYDQLKGALMEGALFGGMRLVEHELASQLRVSRTPVREALKRLEAEGFVESSDTQGLVVKSYSDDEIREIYEIRVALECLAAERAAKCATSEEIEYLGGLVERMDDSSSAAVDELTPIHQAFSEAFVKASHMPKLIRMIESLRDHIARCRAVSLRAHGRAAAAKREHAELFDALVDHDAERASQLTKEHIKRAAEAYFSAQTEGGDASSRRTQLIPNTRSRRPAYAG